jgi:hypothetical protein
MLQIFSKVDFKILFIDARFKFLAIMKVIIVVFWGVTM